MKRSELAAMLSMYQLWAHSACAPVFWCFDGQSHNGSMTLLETSSQVLGITNAHVADGLANCTYDIGQRCQIGGAYLDPLRLIAKHPSLDLATFRLSDVLLASSEGHRPITVPSWPPSCLVEGDTVMFGGYPGTYREELPSGRTAFKFAWFAGTVRSVSDTNVGMVLEIERSHSLARERIQPHADLGGWSGGPVFRVVERQGIERLELAAIIYEYTPTFEIALAHPLTNLCEDGTFSG